MGSIFFLNLRANVTFLHLDYRRVESDRMFLGERAESSLDYSRFRHTKYCEEPIHE